MVIMVQSLAKMQLMKIFVKSVFTVLIELNPIIIDYHMKTYFTIYVLEISL